MNILNKKECNEISNITNEYCKDCQKELTLNKYDYNELLDPAINEYWKDYYNRYIYIYSNIKSSDIEYANKIIEWNNQDEKEKIPINERQKIKILFYSRGGDLDTSLSLYQIIKSSKTPVVGINMGYCCSGAALIYSACHERLAFPQSYFLIHYGYGSINGSFLEVSSEISLYNNQVALLLENIYSNLNKEHITKKDFVSFSSKEWYLYSASNEKYDGIKIGLVQKIISSLIF